MYDKFYAYLAELNRNYAKLAELLTEKLNVLESFNLVRLDAIIKEEQVFVLISRGFDSNVQGFREKLGLRGETLSEIIEELPAEETQRFRDVFKSLKSALDEVKTLNQKCQSLIEERLYSLDKAIKELDRAQGAAYGKNGAPGEKPDDPPHLFTKSV